MMSLVVDGIVNLLAAAPDAVAPSGRIGDRWPATSSDLPFVSISLTLDPPRANGIGSYVREGHQLVQNTSTIDVGTGPDSPFVDLQTLRILPLPLKRNPASTRADFSETDVSVRLVTDPNHRVSYRLVAVPMAREEYAIDATSALVRFGAAQVVGDKLEVVHWTLAFRDDIVSVRYSGSVSLNVWAKDAAAASALSRSAQAKLAGTRETLRAQGFPVLRPAGLGPAASVVEQPGAGSSFPAWRQTLAYRFAFETELGGADSGGGAIRRIDVHANGELREPFTVPASTT